MNAAKRRDAVKEYTKHEMQTIPSQLQHVLDSVYEPYIRFIINIRKSKLNNERKKW